MKLGFDLDGVLADFNTAFIELIRQQTGIVLPRPSATYPDVWNYHVAGGVTPEQEIALWNTIGHSQFWGTLHAYPETLEVLDKLTKLRFEGHDIYFVTSRPGEKAKFLTERWLSLHGMNNPTVLVTSDKGPVVQGLGLEAFIDDKPENLTEIDKASPSTRLYLYDAPYNRPKSIAVFGMVLTKEQGSPFIRVKSVKDMLDMELGTKALLPEAA